MRGPASHPKRASGQVLAARLLPLWAALLCACPAGAQVHWLDKFDGAQACHIVDIAVDASGHAYVVGDLSSVTTVSAAGSVLATMTTQGGPDVLVARFAPDGSLDWAVSAGGASVDLGLKVAWGPSGLAVTGVFTGQADLFGTPVQAQGGSTDLFVALLDPANGQPHWVRTAGSPGYTDTPGGIAMNSAGEVRVAGRFKGDAVFGPDTLHSGIDPATGLPSFDVFIAAFSALGDLQWVKQGTGTKDCFAVDLACGPDDQLYVTGQFSDTITFDVMHPGVVQNSLFLVKLDAQGNEQWFRKAGGGSYNQVSDLRWSDAGDLLLTGDVIGSMQWSDGVSSTPILNPYARAYFILRASAAGALLAHTTMGSAGAVHAASITEQADSVVVYGEFACAFTGLQAAYGADGLFLAKGAPDLFIAKHAAADLAFVGAQQFAGVSTTGAGAVANTPDGLLFSGSFTDELYLPRGAAAWGDPGGGCAYITPNSGTYCNDPYYSAFTWATGSGSSTGFLTKGYVEGRQPYDFWKRSGADCNRQALMDGVQILLSPGVVAPDTVTVCNAHLFDSAVPFPRGENACSFISPTVGPFDHQLWSTSSVENDAEVNATGWVSFSVFSGNGCFTWTDSVFVNYEPFTFSDSSGTYQHVPLPLQGPLVSCTPMTVWVEQGGAYWVLGGDTTFSDTMRFNATGTYLVSAPTGCSATVEFELLEPINITGVNSQLVGGDTIQTCNADCLAGYFSNTWFVDGVETVLPVDYLLSYQSYAGCNQTGVANVAQLIPWGLPLNGTGWYTIESHLEVLNADCGNEPFSFMFTDSVYVEIGLVPAILPSPATDAPVQRCADDTLLIVLPCLNCDTVYWGGPGLVWASAHADSVLVNQNGTYYATPVSFSGNFPCTGTVAAVVVAGPVPPPILQEPADGLICPNDSALLFTSTAGIDHVWTGPGTAALPNADSIWVNEPGDYYLSVTLYTGCNASNGPATVSFFGSPAIAGPPGGLLCPGGTADLHVEAGPGATVQWLAPLSGNALVQTVSAPGLYACQVQSCGTSWNVDFEVVLSSISAELGADTFALCGNAPITLTAPPGAATYLWLPTGATGPQLVVSSPGTHELIATDVAGCSVSSGPITVVLQAPAQPAAADGASLCAGDAVTLTGSGSGDLFWYASADATDLLAEGTLLTFTPAATDTVYLVQVEQGCTGAPVPVVVLVLPAPAVPMLSGDSVLCTGELLLLQATGTLGSTFSWSTPGGGHAGPTLSLPAVVPADAGTYACHALLGTCASDTAHWMLSVEDCTAPGTEDLTPNVITPNGDGVNDVFRFAGEGFLQAELQVFNRWGQQVAVLLGRNAYWDGRSTYSGELLPEGVYFYVINAVPRAGDPFRKAGYIQLLR